MEFMNSESAKCIIIRFINTFKIEINSKLECGVIIK